MPRLTDRNPRYCKHRASGQAIVTIDGHDIYLGPYGTKASKLEYDRVVAEWLANGRRLPQGNAAGPSDITITEIIDRFLTHAQAYYRHPDGTPTGECDTFKSPLRMLRELYGRTQARDFGPLALQAVRQKMIDTGWCRTHINSQVARLRIVFKWAVSKELIPASVHHGLATVTGLKIGRTEARESEPVRPVPDAVVDATLPHVSSVIGAMVQVQRYTGCRPGEVCRMTTGSVDTSAAVWVYTPATHKTSHHGHARTIYIGPKAQAVLQPFLKPLNPTAYIFSPADAEAEMRQDRHESRRTPVSCGNVIGSNRVRRPRRAPGDVYDVHAYRRAVARGCDAADRWAKAGRVAGNDERMVPRWHVHQLRHSAATEIRKAFGLEGAQAALGHATLSAAQVYAEKNADTARRIAAAVG
jgi:integrase